MNAVSQRVVPRTSERSFIRPHWFSQVVLIWLVAGLLRANLAEAWPTRYSGTPRERAVVGFPIPYREYLQEDGGPKIWQWHDNWRSFLLTNLIACIGMCLAVVYTLERHLSGSQSTFNLQTLLWTVTGLAAFFAISRSWSPMLDLVLAAAVILLVSCSIYATACLLLFALRWVFR